MFFLKLSRIYNNYCREITFDEFDRLLHEVSPKFAKDHKLRDNEDAFNMMLQVIASGGPSLAGTTVSVDTRCF